MATGTAAPIWGQVLGLFQPQSAQLTDIRTDSPINDEQQKTNRILFIVAMVLVLGVTAGAVYYFIKK